MKERADAPAGTPNVGLSHLVHAGCAQRQAVDIPSRCFCRSTLMCKCLHSFACLQRHTPFMQACTYPHLPPLAVQFSHSLAHLQKHVSKVASRGMAAEAQETLNRMTRQQGMSTTRVDKDVEDLLASSSQV